MEITQATVVVSNPGDASRRWEGLFLVDTAAVDCMVPGKHLRAIGVQPEGRRSYELADGSELAMEIAIARIELMGDVVDATVIFGPDNSEPILGVAALESVGIEVAPRNNRLKREALAARFDPQLLLRLDQAMGEAAEIIVPHRPPPEITAELELEFPSEDRQTVDTILAQLMERISRELAARQRGAIQLECRFASESGETVRFVVGLFRASAQVKHLLELTQMQLERTVLAGAVKEIKLAVLLSAPLEAWQPELFESSHREGRRQVAQLVDRLSNRLGREAVVRAMPQAEAQPELAFRYEPLAGRLQQKSPPRKALLRKSTSQKASSRKKTEPEKSTRWKLLPRPLRLEREPIRLDVVSVVPDGPPIQFHLDGVERVARAWGPERIQTGWWRGRCVERDYYRIETATGRRFWLFRRLSDEQWFLHGEFD